MVEAAGLKNKASRSPAMASLPTKFHKNQPTGSKLLLRGRQAGDLISHLSIFEK
jgi:hypothetical protein